MKIQSKLKYLFTWYGMTFPLSSVVVVEVHSISSRSSEVIMPSIGTRTTLL